MGVEMAENNGDQDKQETGHVITRHYCKVCNRGFGCAGALGGHMRAHVMGDVSIRIKPEGNKHSYFLRAKSARFMGSQASEDDGKSDDYSSASSEEEDLANCLVMLSNRSYVTSGDQKEANRAKEVVDKGMFQCKACKKVFTSHQALGGHRASHKKVKGCFAAKLNGVNDDENVDDYSIQEDHEAVAASEADAARPGARKRTKMHECSVCRRVFSSGQALGGHKRCHWLTTSTDNAFIPNFHDFQYDHQSQQLYKKQAVLPKPQHDHESQLDLNLNLKADQNASGDSDQTASTRLYLQQWGGAHRKIEEGVAEREVKLRKLSDLRDVNLDGGWLQMGIASTTDIY